MCGSLFMTWSIIVQTPKLLKRVLHGVDTELLKRLSREILGVETVAHVVTSEFEDGDSTNLKR